MLTVQSHTKSASEVRNALKGAVHFQGVSVDENSPSKFMHEKTVPFVSTVYPSAGCSLSTEEINERYEAGLSNAMSLALQLLGHSLSRNVFHLPKSSVKPLDSSMGI